MAAIQRDCPVTPQLAGYRFLQASTVYYAGGPVPEFDKTTTVKDFIASAAQPYIITTTEYLPELEREWPGGFLEVARMPEFLHKGKTPVDVMVLKPTEALRLGQRGVGGDIK